MKEVRGEGKGMGEGIWGVDGGKRVFLSLCRNGVGRERERDRVSKFV